MSTEREKLIELLQECICDYVSTESYDWWVTYEVKYEELADHLIANGVHLEEKQATSDESKWIPVTERLPDMYQNVLAIRADGKIVVDAIGSLEIWYKQMDIVGRPVTHWMPLPEPPKGE